MDAASKEHTDMGRILITVSIVLMVSAIIVFLLFDLKSVAVGLLIASVILSITGGIIRFRNMMKARKSKSDGPDTPISID